MRPRGKMSCWTRFDNISCNCSALLESQLCVCVGGGVVYPAWALDPDQWLLSVSQVVPEHRQIRRKPSSLETNISLQSSEPVMVRDSTLSHMSPKLLLLLILLLLRHGDIMIEEEIRFVRYKFFFYRLTATTEPV